MAGDGPAAGRFARFDRKFLDASEDFTVIGTGSLGGKALGLAFIRDRLASTPGLKRFSSFEVSIPRLTVLATDLFDAFLAENNLEEIALSDASDTAIALAFQRANLPASIVGDLRALIQKTRQPLAVRSSSLLEDALYRPFAGVYGTKMIPNNQADPETRFRKLVEAIKFVYASAFLRPARSYLRAAGKTTADEKMAVILQEVVGSRHEDRFYPDVSGVGRSINFYPTGHAKPEDGVMNLALGLGKTIVDGGVSWMVSPAWPRAVPPLSSPGDFLRQTQNQFWAVNMGKPPDWDPIRETEYLVQADLSDAEADDTLKHTASTFDPASDRLIPGTGRSGARVLTFAGLLDLETWPLAGLLKEVLRESEAAVEAPVEIEFAVTLPPESGAKARFGFLQVRPLALSEDVVEVSAGDLTRPEAVVVSEAALGNGANDHIADVVYVRPERFDMAKTEALATTIDRYNRELEDLGRPYVLIGFGRWGSSDPWLGIPVKWQQISGACVIVEASLPGSADVEPSQGSHFFHNMTSFRVLHFTVRHTDPRGVDWDWLDSLPAVRETEDVRHVRVETPFKVRVDGRSGRGVILR